MPGKLRKSRSRNNNSNNRPASKQSRNRKTPKGNRNTKGKRTRHRNRRQNGMLNINKSKLKQSGGAENGDASTDCTRIDENFIKGYVYETKNVYDSIINETKQKLNFFRLTGLTIMLNEILKFQPQPQCEKKFYSVLETIIKESTLTTRGDEYTKGVEESGLKELLEILLEEFLKKEKKEEYDNKFRHEASSRVKELMRRAISNAINNTLTEPILGWPLLNKQPKLEELEKLTTLKNTEFIIKGFKLLFTDEDEDITCQVGEEGGIGKKIGSIGIDFFVERDGSYLQYTNIGNVLNSAKSEYEANKKEYKEKIEGKDKKFIKERKLKLNDSELETRKKNIKDILFKSFRNILLEEMKKIIENESVVEREKQNKIKTLKQHLAIITNYWFNDFCHVNDGSVNVPPSGTLYAERLFKALLFKYKENEGIRTKLYPPR